jgi:membrane protease YdiL (CAAX protease family)
MAESTNKPPAAEQAETYWVESRRPLAALAFIAPLLVVYEVGVLALGAQNGADALMRRLLGSLGFGQHLVLPMLTVCILLGWQYLSRQPWRISVGTLPLMAVECLLLGFALLVVAWLSRSIVVQGIWSQVRDWLRQSVGYLGAGIYEELLFRLILFGATTWALNRVGMKPRHATIAAAVVISLLFAAAHHIGPGGEDFSRHKFVFRTLAGLFFTAVFVYRGFGIAAGSHAAYNLLTEVF